MDLRCYLYPGWKPDIRPAEPTRPWMDAAPDAFAYRCLPLNIANAHGWEILSPCGLTASWNGQMGTEGVTIRADAGTPPEFVPASLFGQAVLTFHIFGLFRTEPGWNLWVGGSPNRPKDAIYPLTGVIETDWSPYTFTMNWRFTRRNHAVRFERGEPMCFVFPLPRAALEETEPKLIPMHSESDVKAQFDAWSRSRDAFQAKMVKDPPKAPADRWQKRYYRGVDMHDRVAVADHRAKLRLRPFVVNESDKPE